MDLKILSLEGGWSSILLFQFKNAVFLLQLKYKKCKEDPKCLVCLRTCEVCVRLRVLASEGVCVCVCPERGGGRSRGGGEGTLPQLDIELNVTPSAPIFSFSRGGVGESFFFPGEGLTVPVFNMWQVDTDPGATKARRRRAAQHQADDPGQCGNAASGCD